MCIKIRTLEDLFKNLNKLPVEVVRDIDKRMTDWISAGGNENDGYIQQQLIYAENIIKSLEKR